MFFFVGVIAVGVEVDENGDPWTREPATVATVLISAVVVAVVVVTVVTVLEALPVSQLSPE